MSSFRHSDTCVFVLYKICPLILGCNDGLDDEPFLPVGQHDAVVIVRQQAKQAVTPFGGHRLPSEDDKTHCGRRLGLLGRYRLSGNRLKPGSPDEHQYSRTRVYLIELRYV